MRTEIFKLWHLIQKREELMTEASCVSSPGFEPHYNSGRKYAAPYEHYVMAACDLQEDIDNAVLEIIKGYENDNQEILNKSTGQRQRALRLCFICAKSDEYIAGRLGINVRTVEIRLRGKTAEKAPEGKFAAYCLETKLLPIDAEIEDYLAETYIRVEEMADEKYDVVDKLIRYHKHMAEVKRKQYERRTERINGIIDGMEGKAKIIVRLWYEGKSWDVISKAAGCSMSHAKKLLSQNTK